MNHGLTPATAGDRLGLADLPEISDLLLRAGFFRFRVASWSMYPTLWKGDQLTVEPASATGLRVGDVILFHQRGQLICHRVVALDTAGPGVRIVTKGDAAAACDTPLHPDDVLGRVVRVRPGWHWPGSLSKRIDSWLARLRDEVAQRFLALQGLRSYRRLMRALFSRGFAYYIGSPEGRRWLRYRPSSERGGGDPELTGHADFHLLAKLAGASVGSLHGKAGAEGYLIESLHVRVRYRGLGVGSGMLALAAAIAAGRSRSPVLLASIEPANMAALRLFTKAGFRHTGGLRGNQVSLRREL